MWRLVDLSHEIHSGMPVGLGSRPVEVTRVVTSNELDPLSVRAFHLSMGEHVGTHIDAPFHFCEHGKTVDELVLEKLFMIDAVLLDVSDRRKEALIALSDVLAAERYVGGVRKGDAVVISTGCYRDWGTPAFYSAPYLAMDAARYLADKGMTLLVTDAPTVDDTRLQERPVHRFLLSECEIPVIECAVNLGSPPLTSRFKLVALPLRIRGGSGSPLRLVAVVEEVGGHDLV